MPEALELNNSTLKALPIDAPKYDRGSVSVGIAHIGAGHFHRAHQAAYINLLLQHGVAHDWGICGVGVMPADFPSQVDLPEEASPGTGSPTLRQNAAKRASPL